ncbi:MAG: calcium/sodium antiporter [Chloroflexaceae bacterium]|nr:calcium/sodium antiporter [Chloroflexaceae bacterium]
MDFWTIALMIIGVVLLVAGAEILVRGASHLATAVGIPPLIVGLTVVSFGTSSPELAVAVQAAFSGEADITIGNVVGSNIFNILVILGLSAVITPLVVSRQLVRFDVPLMIGISFLLLLLASDGVIDRIDGLILFAGIVGYIAWSIYQGRREPPLTDAQGEPPPALTTWTLAKDLAMLVGGIVLLMIGSQWMVDGAVAIAEALGISSLIIGLTVIAAGTSLPEVATSLVAAIRGQNDIAVGNAVGSNIFNILAIVGLTALLAPDGIAVSAKALQFDIPFMIAVAIACLPIFFTGYRISRWEGWLFIGYYIVYTMMLILEATGHEALSSFQTIFWFISPIIAITLVILALRMFWLEQQAKQNEQIS